MNLRRCTPLVVITMTIWLAGCQKQEAAPPPSSSPVPKTNSAAASIPGWPPTKAQPKLPTLKIFVGPEVVTAELALTQVQIGTGMMFRKEMAENDGMLFVFSRPHRTSFYMRNTTLPLTAAYIDSEGIILELHDLEPLNETPVEAGSDNVQFVLEMNRDWFKRHNVTVGAAITCEGGKLRDAFRMNR